MQGCFLKNIVFNTHSSEDYLFGECNMRFLKPENCFWLLLYIILLILAESNRYAFQVKSRHNYTFMIVIVTWGSWGNCGCGRRGIGWLRVDSYTLIPAEFPLLVWGNNAA